MRMDVGSSGVVVSCLGGDGGPKPPIVSGSTSWRVCRAEARADLVVGAPSPPL